MTQATTTNTNTPRRAHPAAVHAALRSRSRHAYARVTEACDAITYPDGATYTYTYDTESGRVAAQQRGTHRPTPCGCNRLIEVHDANNTLIASYTYDPFGRRLSKDMGNSKTYFFYNAEGLIAEADATGVLTKSYGYAPGSTFSTNPLWMKTNNQTGTPAYYTYQNDHLGTPMKLLNQSGVTVWSATYDAFGKATVDPSSSITNNLRFPGQYYDAETGLHYNLERYYDPATGRYSTSDPIGLEGGVNEYIYAENNTLRWADPTGRCPWCVAAGVGAITGAGVDIVFQLLQNGGNLKCVNWGSVGMAALSGAALSGLGPTGFLFGRGGARASQYGYNSSPGILNRGNVRLGWSGPKNGSDVISGRVGNQHFDIPGTGVPSGANPLRDGSISGALGGGANRVIRDPCGCK